MKKFTPGKWNVPAAEYYADRECVSHSMLEIFRASIPVFRATWVGDTEREATKALDFGNALHTLLLEPSEFSNKVAAAPSCDRRTKVGKEVYEDFLRTLEGRIAVTEEQIELLKRMQTAVLMNDEAAELLLADGPNEQAIRWECQETGLRVRSRLDKIIPSRRIILDLKTTEDCSPGAFAWSVMRYGYHRQAALYLDGVTQLEPAPWRFLFLAVAKTTPSEAALYELDEDMIELGAEENLSAMRELRDCMDFDDWQSRHKGITLLTNPRGRQS